MAHIHDELQALPGSGPMLQAKDFKSDQMVRWCPGCGDFAVLSAVQKVMPTLGIAKENIVFVSGIGCSSRFPYYMNTFGFHTIHGRALTLATGIKCSKPDLQVWVVTGDGDCLSIGGNHLLHALRRNVDVKVLRAKYLVPATGFHKVKGQSFKVFEIEAAVDALLKGGKN